MIGFITAGEVGGPMKIKVESDKIIKAVRKLSGIEVVLESADDAKEAIHLVLSKAGLSQKDRFPRLKEVKVTSFQEYKTSAVDYRMFFLLEFVFEESASMEERASSIKEIQDFFQKV